MKTLIKLTLVLFITAPSFSQSIKVKKTGEGDPMFFFPHIGCSSEMWDKVVAHYSKSYACYQFDFAGFAGMEPLEGDYTNTFVFDISKFIAEEGLKDIILVGQNYGAFIAAKLAIKEGDKISKILASDFYPALKMVLDTAMTDEKLNTIKASVRKFTVDSDSAMFATGQQHIAKGMNFIDTTYVPSFVEWQLTSDRETLSGTLCEQLSEDLLDELKDNKIPILALSTWYFAVNHMNMEMDDAPKALNRMFKTTPNVKHEVTTETKDFIHIDAPEWYIAVTENFLNSNNGIN